MRWHFDEHLGAARPMPTGPSNKRILTTADELLLALSA
jgi:hypothetical protein